MIDIRPMKSEFRQRRAFEICVELYSVFNIQYSNLVFRSEQMKQQLDGIRDSCVNPSDDI